MKIYDISQEVFSCQVFPGDPAPEKRRARNGNLFFPGFRRKRTRPQGSIGKGRNPKKSKALIVALIVNSGCS